MLRLAANLGYLFAERPPIERFAAAAAAGFKAVELLFPYDQPPADARREIEPDLAAEKRLTLLIEPLNRRDRPNYLIQRPEHAAELIARIGRPNVRIQFDFYHVQIEGGDLMTRFERHLPLIGHVQIAAVPSRAEPDEGEVNYPAILAMLDRSTYAGYVSCEYKPRGRTEDGLSWAARYLGKL